MTTVPPSPFSPLDVHSLLLRHCAPLTHHCFADLTDGHAVAGAADGRALRADGRDLQLLVVSPSFAGAAPLERQRRVHAAFAPLLASGVVHSVQIRCWTPAQWEKLGRPPDLGRPCALAATHDDAPSTTTTTTTTSTSSSSTTFTTASSSSSSTSFTASPSSLPPSSSSTSTSFTASPSSLPPSSSSTSTSITASSSSLPPSSASTSTSITASSSSLPPSSASTSTSMTPSSTAARYSLPSCTEIPTEGPTAEMVLQHLLHKRPADAVACARAILSCAAAAAAARTAAEQLLARQ